MVLTPGESVVRTVRPANEPVIRTYNRATLDPVPYMGNAFSPTTGEYPFPQYFGFQDFNALTIRGFHTEIFWLSPDRLYGYTQTTDTPYVPGAGPQSDTTNDGIAGIQEHHWREGLFWTENTLYFDGNAPVDPAYTESGWADEGPVVAPDGTLYWFESIPGDETSDPIGGSIQLIRNGSSIGGPVYDLEMIYASRYSMIYNAIDGAVWTWYSLEAGTAPAAFDDNPGQTLTRWDGATGAPSIVYQHTGPQEVSGLWVAGDGGVWQIADDGFWRRWEPGGGGYTQSVEGYGSVSVPLPQADGSLLFTADPATDPDDNGYQITPDMEISGNEFMDGLGRLLYATNSIDTGVWSPVYAPCDENGEGAAYAVGLVGAFQPSGAFGGGPFFSGRRLYNLIEFAEPPGAPSTAGPCPEFVSWGFDFTEPTDDAPYPVPGGQVTSGIGLSHDGTRIHVLVDIYANYKYVTLTYPGLQLIDSNDLADGTVTYTPNLTADNDGNIYYWAANWTSQGSGYYRLVKQNGSTWEILDTVAVSEGYAGALIWNPYDGLLYYFFEPEIGTLRSDRTLIGHAVDSAATPVTAGPFDTYADHPAPSPDGGLWFSKGEPGYQEISGLYRYDLRTGTFDFRDHDGDVPPLGTGRIPPIYGDSIPLPLDDGTVLYRDDFWDRGIKMWPDFTWVETACKPFNQQGIAIGDMATGMFAGDGAFGVSMPTAGTSTSKYYVQGSTTDDTSGLWHFPDNGDPGYLLVPEGFWQVSYTNDALDALEVTELSIRVFRDGSFYTNGTQTTNPTVTATPGVEAGEEVRAYFRVTVTSEAAPPAHSADAPLGTWSLTPYHVAQGGTGTARIAVDPTWARTAFLFPSDAAELHRQSRLWGVGASRGATTPSKQDIRVSPEGRRT
jgi:hypothetical protein